MSKKVVYIAGPYRGASESRVWSNIMFAREQAAAVWQAGAIAVCPHLNTMLMGGVVPDETILSGDIEILRRCDGVLLIMGWKQSEGARAEASAATLMGMPTFETMAGLVEWLGDGG